MAATKNISPKMANQKRPTNPEAKLAGFQAYAFLQLQSNILAFPDRPILTDALGDKEYVTAITGATANKPFGTTAFAKVEVVKNSIKLGGEGDFSKNNTAVKSSVEVTFYAGDKEAIGFGAKLKGADVSLILPKYNGDYIWLGHQEVPAKVVKYVRKDEEAESDFTLTIEFEPYEPLFLADGSIIDKLADA